MDLQLQGKSALVCGSSKGLGYACAMSLAREGVALTLVARTADLLEQSAETIRQATGPRHYCAIYLSANDCMNNCAARDSTAPRRVTS